MPQSADVSPINDNKTINPGKTSWLEPIPIAYRKRRAFLALGIGAALSASLWSLQLTEGVTDGRLLFGLIPAAIGLYRYVVWIRKESIRRYASVYVVYSKRERLTRAAPWVIIPLAGCGVVWSLQYSEERLEEYWWYVWPMWIIACVGIFRFLQGAETQLTPAAAEELAALQKAQAAQTPEWLALFEKVINMPWVRYPLAAVLIWFAYEWSQDPKVKMLPIVGILVLAAFAAKELVLWSLGAGVVIGVVVLLVKGAAALPISVAIIIGALIIASAISK